jgi:hypothetical protein
MPNLVHKVYDVACDHEAGVVYRFSAIHRANRPRSVEKTARRLAKQAFSDAQSEADAIRQSAFAEGYRDGMTASLEQVVSELVAVSNQLDMHRHETCDALQVELRSIFSRDAALLALFDDFLEHTKLKTKPSIVVAVPRWSGLSKETLRNRLKEDGVSIEVTSTEGRAFSITCDTVGIDFVPELGAAKLMGRLAVQSIIRNPKSIKGRVLKEVLESVHLLIEKESHGNQDQ